MIMIAIMVIKGRKNNNNNTIIIIPVIIIIFVVGNTKLIIHQNEDINLIT